MSGEIKIGDVIRLKSGGPRMTVSEVDEDSGGTMSVWCEWFDEKNVAQRGTFSLTSVALDNTSGPIGIRR